MIVKTIGREYQHPEDLVFSDPCGVTRLQYIFKNIQQIPMTVKWDGSPTIYFGRDDKGKFTLVGKNGWGRDWISSIDELISWNLARGKQESWRQRFTEDLAKLWRIIESNFPETETGFYYADVLWHPGNPCEVDGKFLSFTPNKVTYSIEQDTDLAGKIINSKLGLAIHKKYEEFHKDSYGRVVQKNIFESSDDIVVMSQTTIDGKIKIDEEKLGAFNELVKDKNFSTVNKFIFEKRPGLADFREIIYNYTNSMVKEQKIDRIPDLSNFVDWIKNSKLSFNKQGKMESIIKQYSGYMSHMFDIYMLSMEIKDDIIRQLDQNNSTFRATVDGQPGNEGYVTNRYYVKLVPRHTWYPN